MRYNPAVFPIPCDPPPPAISFSIYSDIVVSHVLTFLGLAFRVSKVSNSHLLIHYPQFIQRFGGTFSGAGYALEAVPAFEPANPTAGPTNRRRTWQDMMKQSLPASDIGLVWRVHGGPEVTTGLLFDEERVQARPAWASLITTTGTGLLYSCGPGWKPFRCESSAY